LLQHENAATGDLAICAYHEAAKGEISPMDEANAMQAGIKDKSLALRQKLGKLTTVANPELGDKFLARLLSYF
jgi:hypothetical protein